MGPMSAFSAFALVAVLQGAAPDPDTVLVTPNTFGLEVGASRPLQARVYDEQGDLVPEAVVRWFVTDRDVAAVDTSGAVTALRPGRTQIAAIAGNVTGFAELVVAPLPPTSIELALPVDAVLEGTGVPLGVAVRNRLGETVRGAQIRYESAAPEIATVTAAGRVYGQSAGETVVRALAGDARAELRVAVRPNPAVAYELAAPAAPVRTGDVVRLRVRALTDGSDGGEEIAGIFPLWSVAGAGAQIDDEAGEGVFVAEAPGVYPVTAAIGEEIVRTAAIEVVPRDVAGRLAKVGRGPTLGHHAGDTWVFEGADGRDYAYVGTFMYDWMKAFDVTDPTTPVLTDSVQLDARRINDVKIHPNNRLAVITREGASDRRNGMVLLDLSDPAHPEVLSHYTETVTGGVHNVWIDGENELVYACHNGTSELHIIDIADPRNPREVGRWGLDRESKTLHDVIVQDGYAYLSYWDDGLVILDVGAGTHDGTPTEPAFVSRYSYPEGNTHVAWRYGDYVFVGDEIFPSDWDADRPVEARGYVHVLDVSDIDHPREVARYEVPEAGAHNLWAEDDKLYVGYYQAGLRVVDISGELRGDLYAQGREIAALKTIDGQTTVPNWAMTWGAQLFKGNIFTSDLNSGLWIARLTEQEPVF